MRRLSVYLLLIAATVAVYWPVLGHGFVAWDDADYVVNNERIHDGITFDAVKWSLHAGHAGNWHPVTWWSHMLDCQLYGVDWPGGHHLSNLILHVINAVLLLALLEQMTGAFWRSALVAALFALHPAHVESVAWVSERKDVLSTMFWLLHMLAYVRYTRQESRIWYGLTLVFLALGLMSKPMLVTAPFLLLLLDYWPLGRFNPSDQFPSEAPGRRANWLQLIDEKVPMVVIVAISSVITYLVQRVAMMPDPLWHRLATALTAYARYISKTFYPTNLACFYPNHVGMWSRWQVLGSVVVLVAITAVVFALRQKRYLTVGWFWYLGTLVPVIGLVKVGQQSIADRYLYVPMTGLLIMAVWGGADLCARIPRGHLVGILAAAGAIIPCLWLTPRQVSVWSDTFSLFEHATMVTEDNHVMLGNLAVALSEKGDIEKGIALHREAVDIAPRDPIAHYNLGVALQNLGQLDEAMEQFTKAIQIYPRYVEAHVNLAWLLEAKRERNEAIRHYRIATRVEPDNPEWQFLLANALAAKGNMAAAAKFYREALRLDPTHEAARDNLERVQARSR